MGGLLPRSGVSGARSTYGARLKSRTVGSPSESKGDAMLNLDSRIPGPTDIPNIRQLNRLEAFHQRATRRRTALLIIAANVIGIVLLIVTSA